MGIGKRIEECMRELDLTQSGLAKRLSVERATVNAWIRRDVVPDMDNLDKLSGLFGRSVEWLLRGVSRSTATLTDDEIELVKEMRSWPKARRDAFLTLAKSYKEPHAA